MSHKRKRGFFCVIRDAQGEDWPAAKVHHDQGDDDFDVADLQLALKNMFDQPGLLKDVPAPFLRVYKNQESLENNEKPLQSSNPLDGLGKSENDALIVVVQTLPSK